MMKKILIALFCLALSAPGMAQIVTTKGVATISYANTVSPLDKEKAYRAAQVASIERYFAENGEAESENFEAVQGKVEENLDKFIMSTTVLSEQDQPGLRKYSMAVRTELNVAKLRTTLRGAGAVNKAATGEKSQMVYVFVGRETASVKSFDDRVVQREEVTVKAEAKGSGSKRGRESESIRGNSVSTNDSVSREGKFSGSRSINVETGGSTTRKSDELSYRLLSMANQKTSVTSVFSQSGYLVADPDFVLADADMKALNKDYSTGNDLTPATMRGVVNSLRNAKVPLLVLATFDVNPPSQDDATGLVRVTVSVTGRVMDLRGSLPREVASVPPVQYFALGSDAAVATTKALKDASLAATREIVSRLGAVGVQ
jgi:hypothetical protein